jgi:hypothetical protein
MTRQAGGRAMNDEDMRSCWNCHTTDHAADVRLRVDPTASEFFDGLVGAIPLCAHCHDNMD